MIEYADKLRETVIDHRRTIHRLAELGGVEYKTRDYILKQVERFGLHYEMVTETALIAVLDTGKEGPHIALRADMDALPMKENPENLKGPRVCVSEQENTCHACGHDAHVAMLLGSMAVFCHQKDALCGILYFCFEAGEEIGCSALQMLKALSKYRIDTVWGIHVYAAMESGKIGIRSGACMAGFGGIDITVHGKGGHGSRPDLSNNPVYTAAAIVSNLPGVLIHQLNVEKTVTFGITSIQAGETYNVFPETATIRGSMRYFDEEEGKKALDIVRKTAEHTAALYNCSVTVKEMSNSAGIPVINSTPHAELAKRVFREAFGADAVPEDAPLWYASESFSNYCKAYPGLLVFLGIKNPDCGSGAQHHNERFDIDENALDMGVKATVLYVEALMKQPFPG